MTTVTAVETPNTETKAVTALGLAEVLEIRRSTVYKHVLAGRIPAPDACARPMAWLPETVEAMDISAIKAAIVRASQPAKVISIETRESEAPAIERELPKRAHYKFAELLYYVQRRRHSYLFGPMGSGKSTGAEQAAKAEGLRYGYVSLNPQSAASLLSGFMDAQGRYSETEFYRCYKFGGVFCIDELDNASASLLTTLNSALANGCASFPCGMVERHSDFVLVATGNTSGRGGDWQYPERRVIDSATLDRLAFIEWGYDLTLESDIALSINPDAKTWINWVRSVRDFIANRANGIRGGVYATPRSVFAGSEDLKHGVISIETIADATVFKGLDRDTKNRILVYCPLPA